MLVSAIMSLYQLPLGQYGYTGHVINLPQDVISFAHILPRLPSDLDILVVRKEKAQSHHDFRVRRAAVQEALEWLPQNKYYRANQVQDVLLNQQLLENGDIPELTSLQLDESATNEHSQPSQEDLYGAHLPSSFVPNAQQHQSKRQFVSPLRNVSVVSPYTLMWPTIGGTPIKEFTT